MNILVHVVSSLIISANSASRILFSAYISLFTIQPLGLNVAIQLDSLAFYWLVLNIYCVHVVPFEMEYMSQVTIDLKNTTCAFSKIVFLTEAVSTPKKSAILFVHCVCVVQ